MTDKLKVSTQAKGDRTTSEIKFSDTQLQEALTDYMAKQGFVLAERITAQYVQHPSCHDQATRLVVERKYLPPINAEVPLITKVNRP